MASTLTLDDIRTPITFIFKQLVANLIKVGKKGRVLFVRKNADLTDNFKATEYTSAVISLTDKVLERQIKEIFGNGVKKVIVFEYKDTFAGVVAELKTLAFDWMFSIEEGDQADIASYSKENEIFSLVYNQQSDSMWVVSCPNPSAVKTDGTKLTTTGLLPMLTGVIAGCPYTMSTSYKIYTDLASVELPAEIKEGQYILAYDDDLDGINVVNPCNTLLTLTADVTEDMKSIAIVEGMKRLKTDVNSAFKTSYRGHYKNMYDYVMLFISAVNEYYKELADLDILDRNYSNVCDIDVDALKRMWIALGKDEATVNGWDEATARKMTCKKMVYLASDVKFLDAIEGLQFTVNMF
jgi:hypothetical protein